MLVRPLGMTVSQQRSTARNGRGTYKSFSTWYQEHARPQIQICCCVDVPMFDGSCKEATLVWLCYGLLDDSTLCSVRAAWMD